MGFLSKFSESIYQAANSAPSLPCWNPQSVNLPSLKSLVGCIRQQYWTTFLSISWARTSARACAFPVCNVIYGIKKPSEKQQTGALGKKTYLLFIVQVPLAPCKFTVPTTHFIVQGINPLGIHRKS